MAKKKDKVVIPKTSTDETVIETVPHSPLEDPNYPHGNFVFGTVLTHQGKVTYHATFTPTWRPEIDCGEHADIDSAKLRISDTIRQFIAEAAYELDHKNNPESVSIRGAYYMPEKVNLNWRQISDTEWIATGHDGQVETDLPIAKITQVISE